MESAKRSATGLNHGFDADSDGGSFSRTARSFNTFANLFDTSAELAGLRIALHLTKTPFFLPAIQRMSANMDINRMTHSRDDLCGIQSYYSQSVGPGRYITTNLVPKASGVNPVSVNELLVYPREGYGYNNAAIDADSYIRNQPGFKTNRCQTRAQARPFLSVPYMAGGRGNQDVESLLQHSEQVRMGKECGTVTEQFFSQQYTPMIPILKANVQKPSNLVEEVAAGGWIHGGIPTRSYLRDVNC